ncbi:AraC family transcriptional regulator, partial [Candidatus Saccharibacteria bacterium]|nr:AraC family transcriptional regulator [Candidatus Saccharibacteria bacterium]NIW79427.1 hypothetical protein [Calditrichia bacterium]
MENSHINFWALFYGAAALQGYFLAGLLVVAKRGNRIANRLLAILMLLLSYYLTDMFMGMVGLFHRWPHLLYIPVPLWYLFGPLSYFYVRYLLNQPPKWNWFQLLHLLPFLIVLHRLIPFYGLSGEMKLQYFTGALQPPGSDLVRFLYSSINPFTILVYSIWVLKIIRPEDMRSQNSRQPSVRSAHLSWLKLFFSLMVFYGVGVFFLITYRLITQEALLTFKHFPLGIFSIVLYSVAYIGILQPARLFPPQILSGNSGMRRKLDPAETKRYIQKLLNMMEQDKLYLDSRLKYSQVAARLGISTRYLTEILSQELGQSFQDFVNS